MVHLHRVIKMNGAYSLIEALEHGPQLILRKQSPFKTSVKFKLPLPLCLMA